MKMVKRLFLLEYITFYNTVAPIIFNKRMCFTIPDFTLHTEKSAVRKITLIQEFARLYRYKHDDDSIEPPLNLAHIYEFQIQNKFSQLV